MCKHTILPLIFLLIIVGCKGPSPSDAHRINKHLTGQTISPSYGIVTGVRYITFQNDTGYNTWGTVSGAAIGGIIGNDISSDRHLTIGGAATGILAGQEIQSRLARSHLVELFIRPDDGRDFVIVQPTRGEPFFVGQSVTITYRRGHIIVSPRIPTTFSNQE